LTNWYESPDHDGVFSVAGWEAIGGDWHDVENGDTSLEASSLGPWDMDQVTIHYVDEASGDDMYFTMSNGPWEDWDQFVDFMDDALDGYGVSE
jgi:hypothetical protein